MSEIKLMPSPNGHGKTLTVVIAGVPFWNWNGKHWAIWIAETNDLMVRINNLNEYCHKMAILKGWISAP